MFVVMKMIKNLDAKRTSSLRRTIFCSMFHIPCDLSEREPNEVESVRKADEENSVTGHVQVTLVDEAIELLETNNTSRNEVRNKNLDVFSVCVRLDQMLCRRFTSYL